MSTSPPTRTRTTSPFCSTCRLMTCSAITSSPPVIATLWPESARFAGRRMSLVCPGTAGVHPVFDTTQLPLSRRRDSEYALRPAATRSTAGTTTLRSPVRPSQPATPRVRAHLTVTLSRNGCPPARYARLAPMSVPKQRSQAAPWEDTESADEGHDLQRLASPHSPERSADGDGHDDGHDDGDDNGSDGGPGD